MIKKKDVWLFFKVLTLLLISMLAGHGYYTMFESINGFPSVFATCFFSATVGAYLFHKEMK